MASHTRVKEVIVVPHIIFYGLLLERIETKITEFNKKHPWVKVRLAGVFQRHPLLLEIINERIESAMSSTSALPLAAEKKEI